MNSAADAVNAPEAVEAASEAVGDAVEATEGAVDAASEATAAEAAETAEATVDTATDTAVAATEAATDTSAATTEATSGGMANLLSVDGFNLDEVTEMINGSEIGAFQQNSAENST